jgi:limonene-1,2-epoxide hydrolase
MSAGIEVVRRFGEALTNRDWEAFRELVAEDCEWTDVPSGEVIHGVEALIGLCRTFTAAFPDFRVESLTLIGQGDVVANEWRGQGTHAATGRAFVRTGVGIVELRDGKIAAYRDYFDRQTMTDQVGADWA